MSILVYLPRFEARRILHFIIDTGSDTTMLSPRDVPKILGPKDAAKLQGKIEVESIAGTFSGICFEEAILTFMHEDGESTSYTLQIGIPAPTSQKCTLPSILGRDIMKNFRITIILSKEEIYLEPI
jgi:hypothetical protein